MAYTDNFPQRPVFMADFANGGRIDPRATFSRASTANVWDGSKHLSSDNLLLQSSSLNESVWTTSNASVDATAVTGPDGVANDAWELVENATTNRHSLYQLFSSNAPSDSYTLTFYAKRGTGSRYASIVAYTSTNNYEVVTFDLAGGAVTTYSGSSSNYTSVSATQSASGNGFYKCVFSFTGEYSGVGFNMSDVASPTSWGNYAIYTYTGDGSSSIIASRFSLTTTGATDYNATTTQIHREYAPSLVSKANNVGRFDHTTDGQSVATSLGILIEGSATNLIQQSDSIDNAYWTKQNSTVTAAAAVGVTGELNACLITEIEDVSPATSVHSVYSSSFGLSSATSCTFSLYCKAAGVNRVQLLSTVGGSVRSAVINIANGTVISESSATGAVESVGNGFYRISITYTAPATTNGRVYLNLLNDSGTSDYAGNGYNGVIATGVQFEQNSFASSYIKSNSGSTTTRAAESLSVATADIGYTGGDFSLVVDASNPAENGVLVAEVGDGTASNSARLVARVDGSPAYTVTDSGVIQAYIGNTSSRDAKRAIRCANNDFAYCENGGTVSTDTAGVVPVTSTLYIGKYYAGAQLNGHIKRIAVYNEALSDTNLQALTS